MRPQSRRPEQKKSASAKSRATTSSSQPKRPEKRPLFTTASRGLMAYWFSKWYPITIVRNATRKERGEWLYEIRWTDYDNVAPAGQLPTNESTYPENWIIRKTDIPASELMDSSASAPSAATARTKSSAVKPAAAKKTAVKKTPVFASPAGATGVGPSTHKYKYKWQFQDRVLPGGWGDYHAAGSDLVEEAFQSWVSDPHIDVRSVKSGSWEYLVDFNRMEQTNIGHSNHTTRTIRRVPVDPSAAP